MSKDTIYRQDAIEAVDNACRDWRGTFRRCEDALKALPSADPDVITMRVDIDEKQFEKAWKQALANSPLTVFSAEKKGKWLTAGRTTHYNVCSLCNGVGDTTMKYCPNCGADMRGEQDE